jgi:hypothetical protein
MERSAIRGRSFHLDGFPDYAALHPGYKMSRCPMAKTPKLSVNPSHQKYSTLPKFGNGVFVAALRPKEEGRIAIVTNAGRAAVDVGHIGAKGFAGRATVSEDLAHTTGAICVRRNRVVLTPGVCASRLVVMHVAQPGPCVSHLRDDGGNSASLPGESTT